MNDSSTLKDIKGINPDAFREQLNPDMEDEDFLYLVKSYLAGFGVVSHVSFGSHQAPAKGFELRKNSGRLFVTSAAEGTGLKKGDEIIAVAGLGIDDFFRENQAVFVSAKEERQYLDWAYLVKRSGCVDVVRDGRTISQQIGDADPGTLPDALFEARFLNENTYYMKMEDFAHEEEIQRLYDDLEANIEKIDHLIIDVRVNNGGSDSLYFPLLPYALPEGKGYDDVDQEAYGMEILHTEANVDRRLAEFSSYLQTEGISEETKVLLEEMAGELRRNRGKGFVKYDSDNSYFAGVTGRKNAPEKVYILSDVTCGSSGDNFVSMMKQMPKVTVVGRPTLGILDYSNCVMLHFGKYYFLYPTSRSLAIDEGKGMNDVGVIPDIHIPWSEEHLQRDVDLDYVLSLIK